MQMVCGSTDQLCIVFFICDQILMSANVSLVHNCAPTLRDLTRVPAEVVID